MLDHLEHLDDKYGKVRTPSEIKSWEKGVRPVSLAELSDELGTRLRAYKDITDTTLFRTAAQFTAFIWAMDEAGKIWVAYEEIVSPEVAGTALCRSGYPRRKGFPSHPADEKKLGHPTLLDGQVARIAGELFLDETEEGQVEWHANAFSGRYCRSSPPEERHCVSVHNRLRSLIDDSLIWDDGG